MPYIRLPAVNLAAFSGASHLAAAIRGTRKSE